jgi:hypothetical protein
MFPITMPVQEIRLVSGFARPTDIVGGGDSRSLGVCLYGLRWQQGSAVAECPVDSPAFLDGFYHVEQDATDSRPFRWTNGNAALPPAAIPPLRGVVWLRLELKTWRGSTVQPAAKDAAKDPVAVLGAFESLGCNCEYGLAQRYYNVEPALSLFRWSGTSFEQLLHGLTNRFDGLGDKESTTVVWDATDYRLKTPYVGIHTTSVRQMDEVSAVEVLEAGRPTLRLLRRKLLRDIADARFIFVYRSQDEPMEEQDMRRLHAALREIGPASLLCVTLKRAEHEGDDLRSLGDGLYAGYMDKFVIPDGPFDGWLELCRRTLELDQEYRIR